MNKRKNKQYIKERNKGKAHTAHHDGTVGNEEYDLDLLINDTIQQMDDCEYGRASSSRSKDGALDLDLSLKEMVQQICKTVLDHAGRNCSASLVTMVKTMLRVISNPADFERLKAFCGDTVSSECILQFFSQHFDGDGCSGSGASSSGNPL